MCSHGAHACVPRELPWERGSCAHACVGTLSVGICLPFCPCYVLPSNAFTAVTSCHMSTPLCQVTLVQL
jgi:hypothetical protein